MLLSAASLLLAVALVAATAMFVTNRHHADRPHTPVELATSSKVARAISEVAKVKAQAKGKVAAPKVETAEQKIESVLRKNLDRAAKSMENAQLRPLLINQGRAVLHSAKAESLDNTGNTLKAHNRDLHQALMAHKGLDQTSSSSQHQPVNRNSEKNDGVSGTEDRTEVALRHQLDMETQAKEKKMFQNALKQQHAKIANLGPNSSGGLKLNNGEDDDKKNSGVSTSTQNEEAALRAQLEASTKQKQKEMYHEAFKDWLEKQQRVKLQKAKKQVKIAAREKQMFKETLSKVKKETPEQLREQLQKREREEEEGVSTSKKSSKPSFSTWLKAFKRQLAHRTQEASKKIAENRYIHPHSSTEKTKDGKTVHPPAPAPNAHPILDAEQRKARAERAVKELEKSLKLEEKEEKLVKNDEDSQHTPGKALALLKKTMKKEREALREIAENEKGVGADPNLVHFAPKAKPKKAHNSGILGLDDLDYF